MPKKFVVTGCLCLCFLISIAQSPRIISGTVIDSVSRAVLEDASVTLFRMPGRKLLQQRLNRKSGFLFSNCQPGSYQLIITYLGYQPDSILLNLNAADTQSIVVHAVLSPTAEKLTEVVVKAAIPPVVIKGDTIAFNAGAYPVRPNSTVEDLLRKLPGVQVDKDGNVTVQGQPVNKIYLDGKEFFLGDPKAATQNLPADIVAQIEAYDTETERGKLTGIKDYTGTKTLNIKLKPDRKYGYFGNAYAGVGNDNGGDDAYTLGASATSLGAGCWLNASVKANNINNQFVGDDGVARIQPSGRQTVGEAQLIFREEFSKKISLVLTGSGNSSQTSNLQSSNKQTFLSDSSLLEARTSQSANKNRAANFNADFNYQLDSLTVLQYVGGMSPGKSTNSNEDTVAITTDKQAASYLSNNGKTENSSSGDNVNYNNSLDFRRRFHTMGRSIYVGITQSGMRTDQPASTYSLVNNFDSASNLPQQTLINQRSGQTSSTNAYGAAFTYTEPLAAHQVLDFNYNFTRRMSRSDKVSYAYDSTTGKYDSPDSLTSDHFVSDNHAQRMGAGYNLAAGKWQYQVGFAAQFSTMDNDNYTLHSHIIQRYTDWYPHASLSYNPGPGKSVMLGYSGNSQAPSIYQLQPIPDLTNPFLVRLGNPNLQPQFNHSFNANYNSFNTNTFTNMQVSLFGDYTQHEITTSTTILSGGIQQVQAVNTEGNFHLNSNIAYGFPLGGPKRSIGNGNLTTHLQYGRNVSVLNGSQNVSNNFGWGGQVNVNYHLGDKLFVEGSAGADFNAATYSVASSPNTHSWVEKVDLDAAYRLPFLLTVSSNCMLQVTGAQSGLPAHEVSLWNAAISRDFFKGESCKLRFSVFDLLNSSSSYSQFVGANYIMTSRTNLPGRLFLLSVVYAFRKFPVSKTTGPAMIMLGN